jgi:hypothetical protein
VFWIERRDKFRRYLEMDIIIRERERERERKRERERETIF